MTKKIAKVLIELMAWAFLLFAAAVFVVGIGLQLWP